MYRVVRHNHFVHSEEPQGLKPLDKAEGAISVKIDDGVETDKEVLFPGVYYTEQWMETVQNTL